jgi:IS30 family transposase
MTFVVVLFQCERRNKSDFTTQQTTVDREIQRDRTDMMIYAKHSGKKRTTKNGRKEKREEVDITIDTGFYKIK